MHKLKKAWSKMVLNSCYGVNPPLYAVPMEYDENKAPKITEQGKKNLAEIDRLLNENN